MKIFTTVYVNIVEEKFFKKIMLIFSVLLCAVFQPMDSNKPPDVCSTVLIFR
jgi:hypothetical protein